MCVHFSVFFFCLQQILKRAGKLVRSGSDLETRPHADREAVSQLMGKVKHLMGDFDRRLSFRKKKLNDSVRLHQLTESVSPYTFLGIQREGVEEREKERESTRCMD